MHKALLALGDAILRVQRFASTFGFDPLHIGYQALHVGLSSSGLVVWVLHHEWNILKQTRKILFKSRLKTEEY